MEDKFIEIENKVVEFYRRIVFGSTYKKIDVTNNKEIEINILDYCFNAAWVDMSRHTLSFISNIENEKLSEKDKQDKRVAFKKLFVGLFSDFRNYKTNDDIKNKITECIEIYKAEPKKFFNFTYGQAQKIVNMFFKYLYTFRKELEIDSKYFEICDCPIDNITLKRIFEYETENNIKEQHIKKYGDTYKYIDPTNNNGVVWSKISNKEQYDNIQKIIDKVREGKYETRLDFEFAWQ